MGVPDLPACAPWATLLATLKEPEAAQGLRKTCWACGQLLKTLWNMAPNTVGRNAPCQQEVWDGRRGRSGPPAHPALLARRCGPAHHLGADHHARAAQKAAEPGHLPPAGDLRTTSSSCAGWRTAAARWTLPTTAHQHPGQPYPVAVALGLTPPPSWARSRPCPTACREYQFAGLLRGARTEVAQCSRRAAASAGHRRNRARRPHPARRPPRERLAARARRPVRRPHRLLQRVRRVPRVHRRPHHHAQRCDLPQHLHRQTARRAGRAGPGNERAVRPAAAKAVSRDRGLLPAARRVQLPHGRWSASARPTRATRGA